MNENIKQYPAWQTAIRAAQVIVEQREAEAEAVEIEKALVLAKKQGEELGIVLAKAFGITASPTANVWIADGFRFSLKTDFSYSDWDRDPIFGMGESRYYPDTTCLWFTLFVSKVVPNDADLDFDWHISGDRLVVRTGKPVDGDWTDERGQLAKILDALQFHYDNQLPRYERAKEAAKNGVVASPQREESDEEKFLKLLRRIVREEIDEVIA